MSIKLINGALAVDDRGEVGFVNDFDFKDVKRFYFIKNHKVSYVRAWHGHKKEAKYFSVTCGSAMICAVKIDNWGNPSKNLNVEKFVLSEKKPSILYIPSGYAQGMMTLEPGTTITIYSTTTLEESKGDDYRFDGRYWNPWEVIER